MFLCVNLYDFTISILVNDIWLLFQRKTSCGFTCALYACIKAPPSPRGAFFLWFAPGLHNENSSVFICFQHSYTIKSLWMVRGVGKFLVGHGNLVTLLPFCSLPMYFFIILVSKVARGGSPFYGSQGLYYHLLHLLIDIRQCVYLGFEFGPLLPLEVNRFRGAYILTSFFISILYFLASSSASHSLFS